MEDAPQIGVNNGAVNSPCLLSSPTKQYENNESRDRNPSSQLVVSPISSRPPNHVSKSDGYGDGFDPLHQDDNHPFRDSAPGTRRWHRHETLSLLTIRSQMDAAFRDAIFKAPLWEEVSRRLAEIGFERSANKCKEKFENVTKYYKRSKQGVSEKQQHRKAYRFFKQLEALYPDGKGSSMNNNITGCADEGSSGTFEATAEAAAQKSPVTTNLNAISSSSGSLDDCDDDSGNNNNNSSDRSGRKRKRISEEKMMRFFEKFMEKVARKQEMMQQKYFEIIEKLEQERIVREEAWKRQELARLNAEAELRSRDRALSAARDSALVAFLQKVTGQTLIFPQPQPQPQASPQIHHNNQSEPALEPECKRWPKQEVEALIKVRSGFEARFHKTEPKAKLWDQVSAEMATMGFSRSPKRCKEKWENINKYFRKAKDNTKERHEKATTCPYFQKLDDFYSNAIPHSPSEKAEANMHKNRMDSVILNDNNFHNNQLHLPETGDNSQPDSTNEELSCQNNNVAEKEEKQPDAHHTHSSFMAMLNN
ncbi:hypothetical protein SUGI_0173700 [Cryptomeria japonica]|uniref:trihelix transcription factor DF1 n=1 Tax=Cryptomeria japonica TaxID=3369 RepID=UPI002408E079|nr:trihelix transcription factor DF1 [Cryptomeria japonica]GLJ11656.1 hypothetical protein SUGI_0173700 [Cryptomeria japonica]